MTDHVIKELVAKQEEVNQPKNNLDTLDKDD